MSTYIVRLAHGVSREFNGRIDFGGISGTMTIDAPTRVAAYIRLCQGIGARGEDVAALDDPVGSGVLLGFDRAEIEEIRSAGVPAKIGYPKTGVQIESIVPQ